MDDLRGPLHKFGILALEALRIHNPNVNLLFSPMTASAGLMLIYTGSGGATKYEIENALHLSNFSNRTSKTDYDIQMAYRHLFIQEGFHLNTDFVKRAKQLSGEITEIDFRNDSETVVREKLNSYVNKAMHGRVPDSFDKIDAKIGKDTQFVLANGISFRARWDVPFDPSKTVLRPFYCLDGKSSVNVPTMNATMLLPYVGDRQHDIHYLEIPYLYNAASLLIFLPKKKDGLNALQTAINSNPRLFSRLGLIKRLKEVDLTIPKFTIQAITNFKTVLTSKKLGVKAVFTDKAELSRMVSDGGISLSGGVHLGHYSIDESGTNTLGTTDQDPKEKKALESRRAATSLIPSRLQEIDAAKKPVPIPFIVDHPFLFAVRHNKTGIMVCLGRVETIPSSEAANNEMSKEPEAQQRSSSGYTPVIFRDIYC